MNRENGKFYIGSSNNVFGRWKLHLSRLKNNKHHSQYLQNAWNKYGFQSFSFGILEECSVNELETLEQFYLDVMKPEYNICLVANSTRGRKASDETKKKMSQSRTGEKNPFYGKTHSPEVKQKLKEINTGKKISEETRQKMSEASRGEKNHNFGISKTEEIKRKIREAKKGHSCGERNSSSKLTEQQIKEIREKYASGCYLQKDLAIEYNVDKTNISLIVRKKHWKNVE